MLRHPVILATSFAVTLAVGWLWLRWTSRNDGGPASTKPVAVDASGSPDATDDAALFEQARAVYPGDVIHGSVRGCWIADYSTGRNPLDLPCAYYVESVAGDVGGASCANTVTEATARLRTALARGACDGELPTKRFADVPDASLPQAAAPAKSAAPRPPPSDSRWRCQEERSQQYRVDVTGLTATVTELGGTQLVGLLTCKQREFTESGDVPASIFGCTDTRFRLRVLERPGALQSASLVVRSGSSSTFLTCFKL